MNEPPVATTEATEHLVPAVQLIDGNEADLVQCVHPALLSSSVKYAPPCSKEPWPRDEDGQLRFCANTE